MTLHNSKIEAVQGFRDWLNNQLLKNSSKPTTNSLTKMSVTCVIISNFRSKSSQDKEHFQDATGVHWDTKHFPNSDFWNLGLFTSENHHLSHQVPHLEKKQHITEPFTGSALLLSNTWPDYSTFLLISQSVSHCCIHLSNFLSKAFPTQSFTQPSDCELSTALLTTPLLQKWVECK